MQNRTEAELGEVCNRKQSLRDPPGNHVVMGGDGCTYQACRRRGGRRRPRATSCSEPQAISQTHRWCQVSSAVVGIA